MPLLFIYKLDSDDNPVSTLQIGEHIFGRGPLLKCDDRRVSRKHGTIKVTKEIATITSTHQNPCFYQSADSSTITILPKDSPVRIKDGDKFALLADHFWFRVKLEKRDNLATSAGPLNELEVNPEPTSSSIAVEDHCAFSTDKDSQNFNHMAAKREHEEDAEPVIVKRARSNSINHSGGEEEQKSPQVSAMEDANNDKELEEKIKKEEENEVEDELHAVLTDLKKKEVMSESDSEISGGAEVKPAKQAPAKKGQKSIKEEKATSSTTRKAELKAMLFSSDEEDVKEDVEIDTDEPVNESIVKNHQDSVTRKVSSDDGKANAGNSRAATKNSSNDNGNEKGKADQAGASSSTGKQQHRDHCWYGLSCYRKNAAHLAEYSHPGDSDYETDPNDDRPECAFGDACYRRNKDHRQAYRHSRKPKKPPNKRTKNKNNAAAPKKRVSRKDYNESSEDDYDLEDPFIDSGSEYEADSASSSDTDSDWSGAEEQTNRLLKEANRFTRGKKKDKDN